MAPQSVTIKVQGADELLRSMNLIAYNDAPFVVAYALTKTGQDIKAAEINSMKAVFDRPTPYVLNALQLSPATKDNLQAVVGYKAFAGKGTPAEKFLGPQVEGGKRNAKSHEKSLRAVGILGSDQFCVPGRGAQLDAYGNMTRGQLVQILSQLQASRDPTQNMTARSRKRALNKAGGRYFAIRTGKNAGVYLRSGPRYPIIPVLKFIKAPSYRAIFPFYATGMKVFNERFTYWVQEGFDRFVASKYRRAA